MNWLGAEPSLWSFRVIFMLSLGLRKYFSTLWFIKKSWKAVASLQLCFAWLFNTAAAVMYLIPLENVKSVHRGCADTVTTTWSYSLYSWEQSIGFIGPTRVNKGCTVGNHGWHSVVSLQEGSLELAVPKYGGLTSLCALLIPLCSGGWNGHQSNLGTPLGCKFY